MAAAGWRGGQGEGVGADGLLPLPPCCLPPVPAALELTVELVGLFSVRSRLWELECSSFPLGWRKSALLTFGAQQP